MHFHNEYNKPHMETEPVMNIRFPKAYGAGKQEYQGRACCFCKDDSFQAFENDLPA